jgi:hypothetical protein
VKRKLALALAAGGLMAGPANATPQRVPHYVFATAEECMTALNMLWRGNHAFFCQWGPDGWYVAYDQAYEAARKGPKNR